MFRLIQGAEVLSLSRDYFRLRKPIKRRICEIARKHCGDRDSWRISLPLLQKKVGASSHERAFRAMVRELAEHDHLPDYSVVLEDDLVIFANRTASQAGHRVPTYPAGNRQRRPYRDTRL